MSKRTKAKTNTPEEVLASADVFQNAADFLPKAGEEVIPSMDEMEELSYAVAKKEADAIDSAMESLIPTRLWEMLQNPRLRGLAKHSLAQYKFQIMQYPVHSGEKKIEIWMQGKLRKVITIKYTLNS